MKAVDALALLCWEGFSRFCCRWSLSSSSSSSTCWLLLLLSTCVSATTAVTATTTVANTRSITGMDHRSDSPLGAWTTANGAFSASGNNNEEDSVAARENGNLLLNVRGGETPQHVADDDTFVPDNESSRNSRRNHSSHYHRRRLQAKPERSGTQKLSVSYEFLLWVDPQLQSSAASSSFGAGNNNRNNNVVGTLNSSLRHVQAAAQTHLANALEERYDVVVIRAQSHLTEPCQLVAGAIVEENTSVSPSGEDQGLENQTAAADNITDREEGGTTTTTATMAPAGARFSSSITPTLQAQTSDPLYTLCAKVSSTFLIAAPLHYWAPSLRRLVLAELESFTDDFSHNNNNQSGSFRPPALLVEYYGPRRVQAVVSILLVGVTMRLSRPEATLLQKAVLQGLNTMNQQQEQQQSKERLAGLGFEDLTVFVVFDARELDRSNSTYTQKRHRRKMRPQQPPAKEFSQQLENNFGAWDIVFDSDVDTSSTLGLVDLANTSSIEPSGTPSFFPSFVPSSISSGDEGSVTGRPSITPSWFSSSSTPSSLVPTSIYSRSLLPSSVTPRTMDTPSTLTPMENPTTGRPPTPVPTALYRPTSGPTSEFLTEPLSTRPSGSPSSPVNDNRDDDDDVVILGRRLQLILGAECFSALCTNEAWQEAATVQIKAYEANLLNILQQPQPDADYFVGLETFRVLGDAAVVGLTGGGHNFLQMPLNMPPPRLVVEDVDIDDFLLWVYILVALCIGLFVGTLVLAFCTVFPKRPS